MTFRLAIVSLAAALLTACSQIPTTAEPSDKTPSKSSSAQQKDWSGLQSRVGQYPRDLELYERSVISGELKSLLNDRFAVFQRNMQVSGPLQRQRVLYVIGNRPHEGGNNAGYLLIDTQDRKLEVGLWEDGEFATYTSPGAALFKPDDVKTLIDNHRGH